MKNTTITIRGAFLILTLFAGVALLYNLIDYQPVISTGDHGLVLYAAQETMEGARPFHDFHYFYGPLMPYYYGFFLKIFGNNIISVLIGSQFLNLLSGLIIFCSLSLFLNSYFSFAGSLWFWMFNKEFFYTYNHVGIITCSLFVLWSVLHYLKHNNNRSLYFGLLGCIIAGLIKLNFGFCLLLGLLLSVGLINACEKRRFNKWFFFFFIILTPVVILASNAIFIIGLPFYIIKQCFQYFGNDALSGSYPSLINILKSLAQSTYHEIVKYWYSELICSMIAIVGLVNIRQAKKGLLEKFGIKDFLLLSLIPLIFYLVNLHEFLISGIYFRAFYSFPFIIVLFFLSFGYFARHTPAFVQHTLTSILCAIMLTQVSILAVQIKRFRTSIFYIPFKKARIFVSNGTVWNKAVIESLQYLNNNLKDNELFLALPYDPLYYYLADKKSPTRQLAILKFLKIPLEQEKSIIKEIEDNNVNWVLLSNRAITVEAGIGIFGVDYCPVLAKYIDEHFKPVAQFGEWTPLPSWAWSHGTRILKRKNTP